jgi:hypothetical protein
MFAVYFIPNKSENAAITEYCDYLTINQQLLVKL